MLYTLKRDLLRCTVDYTMGEMVVETRRWHSIEDPLVWDPTPDTPNNDAIANARNKTCIPFGIYEIIINHSDRFGRQMPLLLNVPGRDGIRIHAANDATDVKGCIGLGKSLGRAGQIGGSRAAYGEFIEHLRAHLVREKCFLNVIADLPVNERIAA